MTELPQYIPKTECKGCVFTIQYNGIQEGCSLNRLKNLEANGAVLVKPDGERDFYVIERRNCSTHRDNLWANGKDKSNLDIIVRAEILIRPEVIIVFEDNHNLEQLQKTIESLTKQCLTPAKIVVLSNQDKYKPSELVKLLREQPLAYRLDNILKKGSLDRSESLFYFDDSIRKCESNYYLMCYAGYEFHEDFIATIDELINDKMERFLAIIPKDYQSDVLFLPTKIHFSLEGNCHCVTEDNQTIYSIVDKLKLLAKEQNKEHMLLKYEDFVQRL